MSKPEKWTDDTTCQFVTLYKKHECLWNIMAPEYKNKYVRDRALKNIENEMGIDGFGKNEIKNKIRSLRSTYYLEKKKIEKYKSDSGRYSVYRPTLKWFYIMQDIMNALGKIRNNEDWRQSSQSDNPTSQEKGDAEIDEVNSTSSETDPIKCEAFESEYAPPVLSSPPSKRRKTKLDIMNKKIGEIKDIIVNAQDNDECILFGKYIGLQLKKMSHESRTICQLNIQKLCSEALLNEIHEGSRNITVDVVHMTK